NRETRMWQRYISDLGAQLSEPLERRITLLSHANVEVVGKVFLRPSDDDASQRAASGIAKVGHRLGCAGRVERVETGDRLQARRGVVNRRAEHANVIERRSIRDQAVAAHPAVCRLYADDTTK